MARENVMEFIKSIGADKHLQESLMALESGGEEAKIEGMTRLAAEAGLPFTAEEFEAASRKAAEDQHAAKEDLSAEELKQVTGVTSTGATTWSTGSMAPCCECGPPSRQITWSA